MKRIAIFLGALFVTASPVLAHEENMEEGSGIVAQLNELLPFNHISEGHWISAIISVILWLALIYTVYTLVRQSIKK